MARYDCVLIACDDMRGDPAGVSTDERYVSVASSFTDSHHRNCFGFPNIRDVFSNCPIAGKLA